MTAPQYKLDVSLAWWFQLYLYGLIAFCWLFRTVPDPKKIEATIYRALRLRFIKKSRVFPAFNPHKE